MSTIQQVLVTPVNSVGNSNYDSYYNNVSLLLSMNGSNGSTSFPDTSQNRLTVTANGNAQISTTQYKFGGSSAYFDGNGDYLSIPTNSDFDFGTGDCTIESWIYLTAYSQAYTGSTYVAAVISKDVNTGSDANRSWYLRINGTASSWTSIRFVVVVGSTFYDCLGSFSFSLNTWYHIAATRASGTGRVFVNGTQVGTVAMNGSINVYTGPVTVGTQNFSGFEFWFPGYIDDLRVTKGIARYTANFTPPIFANPNFGFVYDPYYNNVSLLLHMNGGNGSTYFLDNSGSQKTVTSNGSAQISTTQWKFNNSSGYFNGTTPQYLTVPHSADLSFENTSDFTVEAWVYLETANLGRFICSKSGQFNVTLPNWCLQLATGKFRLQINQTGSPGTTIFNLDSTNTIPINQWAHLAATKNGSTYRIFINGVLENSVTNSTAFSDTRNTSLFIGHENSFAASSSFVGYMDDFRITKGIARYTATFDVSTQAFPDQSLTTDPYYYNTSLLLPMNGINASTVFIDASPIPKNVTPSGNAQISITQFKYGGSSAFFDGNGDFLTVTSGSDLNIGSSDFTIEFWVNSSINLSGAAYAILVSKWGPIASGFEWLIDYFNSSLRFFSSTTSPPQITYATTLSAGIWYHIAVVKSGIVTTLYLNGISVGNVSNASYSNTTANVMIAYKGDGSGTGYFNGYIDDVRITKGVARYRNNFTPPLEPFPLN